MCPMEHYVGQRLSLKEQLCTVRYIGPVADKSGEWLGVEWDDTARGKHDGGHDGKKYFTCRSTSPTAASFLRPRQAWDAPRTFYEALREKYMKSATDGSGGGSGGRSESVYFSTKQVEEVGFDKFAKRQAALQGIHVLVLDHMRIRGGKAQLQAEQEVIAHTCGHVTDLDVGSNLFESLADILSLAALFTKLQSLTLDGNRFALPTPSSDSDPDSDPDPDPDPEPASDSAPVSDSIPVSDPGSGSGSSKRLINATSLGLSHTLLSWRDIRTVIAAFPTLSHLAAANNELSHMDSGLLPSTLRHLDLSGNHLRALSDIHGISQCRNLNTLVLKHNQISCVKHEAASGHLFPLSTAIRDLDLAYAAISCWTFFDSLPEAYPALKQLRVTGNPLYKNLKSVEGKPLTTEDGYMLTIARLPQLQTLNYSNITDKERLNAETYYLGQIAAELAGASSQQVKEILEKHPRWEALCEEYGKPILRHEVKTDEIDPNSLAARLATIQFIVAEGCIQNTALRTWTTAIPKSFTIYSVLGMVGKKFEVKPLHLRLIWETDELDPVGTARRGEGPEWWDSSDDEGDTAPLPDQNSVSREVELAAGTRALGTYIEGKKARVRVEVKELVNRGD